MTDGRDHTHSLLLFGGTFDPVHNGHLIVARAAAERLGVDRVLLIPTATPPHKEAPAASAEDRLEMLRLAVCDEPAFEICEMELRRPGPSYTVDTLEALRADRPGARLTLLIGADMLAELDHWRRADRVVRLAQLVTAVRPPWDERIPDILAGLRARLDADAVDAIAARVLDTPIIDISSTEVRRRAAAGRSVRYFVPDAVASYVRDRTLYR